MKRKIPLHLASNERKITPFPSSQTHLLLLDLREARTLLCVAQITTKELLVEIRKRELDLILAHRCLYPRPDLSTEDLVRD